jgi:hypothetical protein
MKSSPNLALEFLGHRRGEYHFLRPIYDVNMAESTNDAYLTARPLAAIFATRRSRGRCKSLPMRSRVIDRGAAQRAAPARSLDKALAHRQGGGYQAEGIEHEPPGARGFAGTWRGIRSRHTFPMSHVFSIIPLRPVVF